MCSPIKKDIEFAGIHAEFLSDFVAEKQAVGYKYVSGAKKLQTFSKFTLSFDIPLNTLPEEVVKAWIKKKPTDADRNVEERLSCVRQFAEYMVRMGYDAYVPMSGDIGKCRNTFVPYIFTHEEIGRIFDAADKLRHKKQSSSPRRHLIMPVLFRLLYCCGLRVSEACNLQGDDVNLETGVLTICDSKFGKSRYVPISDELCDICRIYADTRLVGESEDWFFAAPDGRRYSGVSVYHVFRGLLWDAGISHGGKGNGPRLHDLRHTFAVHCLQKWVENGAELTNVLPRLTAYLGHDGFASTEQYLRMTAEVYPEISALMEEKYGYIIASAEVPV